MSTAEHLRLGDRFAAYVRGGLYPFMLEPGATAALFRNVLEKVVRQDIPRYDPTLSAEDVGSLERTVEYIARCPVDGVNYSSVSSNLGITKYKAQKHLEYLEWSFVVTLVLPAGTNVLKEPKVLRQHGMVFSYAKSTRGAKTPDYAIAIPARGTVRSACGHCSGDHHRAPSSR